MKGNIGGGAGVIRRMGGSVTAIVAIGVIGGFVPGASALVTRATATPPRNNSSVRHTYLKLLLSTSYTGTLGLLRGKIVAGDLTSTALCRYAEVDPQTLRVTSSLNTSCDDPRLLGESVMPVISIPKPTAAVGYVRIASTSAPASAVRLGPVVMRFQNLASFPLQWAFGDGSVWLYGLVPRGTGSSLQRAEVVRISLKTGAVANVTPAPVLDRAELAVDSDGLFLARSQQTSIPGIGNPALIYFIGPEGTSATSVVKHGSFVAWMAASGHTVWAALAGYGKFGGMVAASFQSPTSKPRTFDLSPKALLPIATGRALFDASPALLTPRSGVILLATRFGGGQLSAPSELVGRFDTSSGRESTLTSVRFQGTLQADEVYDNCLYLLFGGHGTEATLFRISL